METSDLYTIIGRDAIAARHYLLTGVVYNPDYSVVTALDLETGFIATLHWLLNLEIINHWAPESYHSKLFSPLTQMITQIYC